MKTNTERSTQFPFVVLDAINPAIEHFLNSYSVKKIIKNKSKVLLIMKCPITVCNLCSLNATCDDDNPFKGKQMGQKDFFI